jgi:UDP-4-amino-4,6-dideoxy-N-acetyl-beta-L-altrosamine N-acetyltransferase
MSDILLLEITKQDLELIRTWRNSKEVSSYMYTDDYVSENQQEDWYNKIKISVSSKYWIIEFKGEKLGLVSITDINMVFRSCSWAFYIANNSFRGAGIGRKVEYTILNYVFEVLNLNKLRCEVFVFNESVIKMHEKFGFRREGYYREHCFKNNAFHDVVALAILKSEWENLKENIYKRTYKENKNT